MKKRSVAAVLLLPFITFGIYTLYWMVKTKGEMNEKGANIPTAWLIIIPFVSIWWMWKYSQGVEHVTGGQMSGVLAFVLLWLLGWIGSAIIQDSFNKVADLPVAPVGAAPESQAVPISTETQTTPPAAEATVNEQTPPTSPTPPAAPTVSG